jgi:putative hydrolase
MTDDDRPDPDDFAEMLRRLLGGQGGIDPAQFSELQGLGIDPAMMQQVMRHLQGAFAAGGDGGIDWSAARTHALHLANKDDRGISSGSRQDFDQAFTLATLWLGEATAISELATAPRALTRGQWVEETLPVWQELAEPVATSITDAMTEALGTQLPEEMRDIAMGAGRLMRSVGGSLFAAQFGAVMGGLSQEVVSGGDVGIPVMPAGEAAILPQNFADFGRDLEIDDDQLALYLAARELAHARLFRHAKWLRLHVISQVTEFARGLHIDTDAIEQVASQFDPTAPDSLREAIESGALLPQRSEAQTAALARLENLLATVEGWVEVVTTDATHRLPAADRIGEAVRRRRAVGGPAERALGSLVGLELRPRRLREAAAMWRAVTDAVGIAARDALWDYPDLMPSAEDIDDPASLIARLQSQARGDAPERDEMDEALDALLADAAAELADAGADERASDAGDSSAADESPGSAGDDEDDDDRPDGHRPV